jgi:hypothetical protein
MACWLNTAGVWTFVREEKRQARMVWGKAGVPSHLQGRGRFHRSCTLPRLLPVSLDAFTISNALVQRAHPSSQHQSQFAAVLPALDCVPACSLPLRYCCFVPPIARDPPSHLLCAARISIHSNIASQTWWLDAHCPSGRTRCWSPLSLQRVSAPRASHPSCYPTDSIAQRTSSSRDVAWARRISK